MADELAKDFTLYSFDRRGRGQSGDTSAYAVTREVEDVHALINRANERVFLYGHSAGAALALRAAASGLNVAGLALADPPFAARGEDDQLSRESFAEEAARVQKLHARGDYEGCVKFFLAEWDCPTKQ